MCDMHVLSSNKYISKTPIILESASLRIFHKFHYEGMPFLKP